MACQCQGRPTPHFTAVPLPPRVVGSIALHCVYSFCCLLLRVALRLTVGSSVDKESIGILCSLFISQLPMCHFPQSSSVYYTESLSKVCASSVALCQSVPPCFINSLLAQPLCFDVTPARGARYPVNQAPGPLRT